MKVVNRQRFPWKVEIDVLDVNEFMPEFSNASYNVTIPENLIASILTVEATDKDGSHQFATIQYSLIHPNVSEQFVINSTTGDISLLTPFDYEAGPNELVLLILAEDGGGLVGVTTVTVSVTDENDNPPEFELSEYIGNIPANAEFHSTIIRVVAHDQDASREHGEIYAYEIIYSDQYATFPFSIEQ